MSVATQQVTRLREVLDMAERLPADEQEMLVEIVGSRIRDRKREALLAQVAEAEEEYRQGNHTPPAQAEGTAGRPLGSFR